MEQNMSVTTGVPNAPTYLGWSICNTLCCCLPIGIVAIVFSIRADTANSIGDSARAHAHSRMAKNMNIAALVVGIIIFIIYIVYIAIMFSQIKASVQNDKLDEYMNRFKHYTG
ncbi:hypothetical protein AMELA_G00256720 [Ameiurus melas]|uniref:Interferon-induced transmembrane protein n=1 Tax=Ameiurus melas TaxID=219545 RepID=A0A7J5ZUA8_AMEME|nr:hypothetical protein AMELA_G00256720 [Ameiurus melas]